MDELVSIVIPVYNVRDYVEQCLDSVLAQTYQNIEVVIVVNGPTDGSDEICRQYAGRDRRIKLVTIEKNQGILPAWSGGVKAASGSWLGFVDADDYIDPDLYRQLMERREDYDLVISRWKRDEEDKTLVRADPLAAGPYRTEEEMDFILEHLTSITEPGGSRCVKPGIFPALWNKLYKTSLAKQIFEKPVENRHYFVDLTLLYQYILLCKSVLITDICGYHYRIRKTSISHGAAHADSYITNILGLYRTLESVFRTHPRCDVLTSQLQRKVASALSRAPRKMNFDKSAWNRTFVFPFFNLLDGKHIALYGAGEIGQAYWRQIRRHGMCEVELWVDKAWEYRRREGWDVSPVEALRKGACEYVVIAAERQDTADGLRKNLLSMGIEEDRILWRPPVEIF